LTHIHESDATEKSAHQNRPISETIQQGVSIYCGSAKVAIRNWRSIKDLEFYPKDICRPEAMRALRYFMRKPQNRIWGRFGFVDASSESRNWYARTYLPINQGPIVIMIENLRTGLLWELFMGAPEVRTGLYRLGFTRAQESGTHQGLA